MVIESGRQIHNPICDSALSQGFLEIFALHRLLPTFCYSNSTIKSEGFLPAGTGIKHN